MGSLGFQTIYRELNGHRGCAAERAFLPEDVEGHRAARVPVCTVETQRPIGEFAALAFSISYELELTGLLEMLDLSGLPVRAADRADSHPIIVCGGPLTFSNPVPLAAFADLVVMGESEDLVHELCDALGAAGSKRELVERLARRPGFWAPALAPSPPPVVKADDGRLPARSQIVTPHTELRNMFLIEPERGCSRGCTYCVMRRTTNGGMRTVTPERVLELLPQGARRVGLVGAAVTDHPRRRKDADHRGGRRQRAPAQSPRSPHHLGAAAPGGGAGARSGVPAAQAVPDGGPPRGDGGRSGRVGPAGGRDLAHPAPLVRMRALRGEAQHAHGRHAVRGGRGGGSEARLPARATARASGDPAHQRPLGLGGVHARPRRTRGRPRRRASLARGRRLRILEARFRGARSASGRGGAPTGRTAAHPGTGALARRRDGLTTSRRLSGWHGPRCRSATTTIASTGSRLRRRSCGSTGRRCGQASAWIGSGCAASPTGPGSSSVTRSSRGKRTRWSISATPQISDSPGGSTTTRARSGRRRRRRTSGPTLRGASSGTRPRRVAPASWRASAATGSGGTSLR